MKKYFFIVALFLVMGSQIFSQEKPLKLGYVDSQIILTQLPEAIKAQGDIDALTSRWSSQVDSMTQELQRSYAEYQKQAGTMPEAKKAEAEKQLVAKQQSIDNFKRQKFSQGTGEIYQKREAIFKPVQEKIYKAIEDVAKKEGMQFVFDKSGDILLLYADSAFDITYKVLDKLKTGK